MKRKKSDFVAEYIRRLESRIRRDHGTSIVEDAAREAADAAEEAGVQWDPEEEVLTGDRFTHHRSGDRYYVFRSIDEAKAFNDVEEVGEFLLCRWIGET